MKPKMLSQVRHQYRHRWSQHQSERCRVKRGAQPLGPFFDCSTLSPNRILGGISHLLQAAQDSRRTGRRNMGRSDVRCCARTGMGAGVGVNARNSALARSNASSNINFLDSLRARARRANSPTFIAILSSIVGTNEDTRHDGGCASAGTSMWLHSGTSTGSGLRWFPEFIAG